MLTKPSKNVAMPPDRPNRWDMVALSLALLVSLTLFLLPTFLFSTEKGDVCVITWDSGETTLSLHTPDTLTIVSHHITLTIEVTEEGVAVTECDCPDKICLQTGTISRAGEMIVCVPADVVIRIPQDSETGGADYVLG